MLMIIKEKYMKKLLIFTIGLLLSTTCYAAEVSHWYLNDNTDTPTIIDSYGTNDGTLHNGLISQWRMNSNWNDSYGSNDGTAYGGATFDTTTPKLGSGSGVFDGTDDYVEIPTITFPGSFTITGWANTDVVDSAQHQVFSSAGNDNVIIAQDSTDVWKVWIYDSSASSVVAVVTGSNTIVAGNWYHLAYKFDASSDTAEFFVNGVSQGTASWTGTLDGALSTPHIGCHPSLVQFFDGKIDDVRIYNRALTATEISNIDNAGNGSETAEASVAIDNSVTGKINNAIDFDGVDDYVDTGLISLSNTDFSIATWVKLDNLPSSWGADIFFSGPNVSPPNDATGLTIRTTGVVDLWSYGEGEIITTNLEISAGSWYHIVATYDSVTNTGTIYVNGSSVSLSVSSFDAVPSYTVAGSEIGARYGIGPTARSFEFDGSIDDVRIYNHALTQSEIDYLYNSGNGTEHELPAGGQVIRINMQ